MRLEQLTFPRFVAALLIVVFHYGKETWPFNIEPLHHIISYSNIGVSFFFVLSGFVLYYVYGKRRFSIKNFYIKRLSRIYPVYLLALFSFAVFDLAIGERIVNTSYILHTIAIQAWFPNYVMHLNYPGWSIAVEFFFYGLFPFVAYSLFKRQTKNYFFWTVLLVWGISQMISVYGITSAIDKTQLRFYEFNPLFHLNEFLVGIYASFLFINGKKLPNFLSSSWFILILIGLISSSLMLINGRYIYHNGLLAPLFGLLIFALAQSNGWLSNIFRINLLILLGEISYTVYIIQFPVLLYFKRLVGFVDIAIAPQWFFWLYLVILLVMSYLIWKFFEMPIRNKLNEKYTRDK